MKTSVVVFVALSSLFSVVSFADDSLSNQTFLKCSTDGFWTSFHVNVDASGPSISGCPISLPNDEDQLKGVDPKLEWCSYIGNSNIYVFCKIDKSCHSMGDGAYFCQP